ncbi:hypothetical protein EJB05_26497, partial [Eragrostis curvula]
MGNSVSSSGEEEIPAGNPASDAPAAGSRASAAASGNKTAAGDATREDEAPAAGNSSTSPAAANSGMVGEETAASDAAKGDEEEPAAGSATSNSTAAASGEKKKRTVRMTQAQVDLILAYTPTLLPTLPSMDHLPDPLRSTVTNAIGNAARVLQQSHVSLLREQEWVRGQMEEKGFVEYEVDDDDGAEEEEGGAEVVLPRRGRRRFRPGVRFAGGTVRRDCTSGLTWMWIGEEWGGRAMCMSLLDRSISVIQHSYSSDV